MTTSTRSLSVSSLHTESSACPELVRRISKGTPDATSSAVQVLTFEAAVIHPPQREGWRDINDRVARLQQNPRRAAALSRARQRFSASGLFPTQTLSALRLNAGLSQAELARRIGTSQSRLSRIEAGIDDPRRTTLVKLAQALNTTVETVSNAIGAIGEDANV